MRRMALDDYGLAGQGGGDRQSRMFDERRQRAVQVAPVNLHTRHDH